MWKKVAMGLAALLFMAAGWAVSFAGGDEEAKAKQLEVDRILAKLNGTRVSIEFIETPFGEAMEFFSRTTELNFVIDPGIYDEARRPETMTINLKADDMKVMTALKIILGFWDLKLIYWDGVLLVTTKESDKLTLRVYDVRDIVVRIEDFRGPQIILRDGDDDDPIGPDYDWETEPTPTPEEQLDEIVQVIRSSTGGDSWETREGTSVSVVGKGLLVVVQTEEVHRDIRKLLAQLRAIR